MRDTIDDHVEHWLREIPTMDPLREQIIGRISKLARHIDAGRTTALADGELLYWQFKTLLMLRRAGKPYEASPSDLADQLGLTRGALSARLAGLEDRGLIERELDAGDRRRVRVRLTDAGYQALDAQLDAESDNEDGLLVHLGTAEKRTLVDLLRKLCLAIES